MFLDSLALMEAASFLFFFFKKIKRYSEQQEIASNYYFCKDTIKYKV
jgi:hypothetical protein